MSKIPKLKKKINSFLTKEDGKISKENLIKTGVLITAFSVGAAMNAKPVSSHASCSPDCTGVANPSDCTNCDEACGGGHENDLNLQYVAPTATGTHNHCIQSCHCSHSSHGSHGSHGSHSSSF